VSEAFANILKHASASELTVRIESAERLHVAVEDDGVGFDAAGPDGSGLAGLRDRIEALGGSFRVTSRPGSGTRLVAELPAIVREASGV
jgi:signal transduction histidine kinase